MFFTSPDDKTLYINSQLDDDFHCLLSCETGFHTVGLRKGKPFVEMKLGDINARRIIFSRNLYENIYAYLCRTPSPIDSAPVAI